MVAEALPGAPDAFWIDDPSISAPRFTAASPSMRVFLWAAYLSAVIPAIALPAIFLGFLSPWAALAWIVAMLFGLVPSVRRHKRAKSIRLRAELLQRQASQISGASAIGSVAHVAGHPLLESGERVVLATVGGQLRIYRYDDSTPVDSIAAAQIQEISLVVYDDERVPHVGSIDAAAQALQVTYARDGASWSCSFNHTYGLRPIDWYQALQAMRARARRGHDTDAA